MTPLAPLTMQELKLSQTLDGANMSPYHTTGEFATSLVLLRSRRIMYTCFTEHTVLSLSIYLPLSISICLSLSLSRMRACPTNMSTYQVCITTSSVHGVNFTAGSSAVSPATLPMRIILPLPMIATYILCPTSQKLVRGMCCSRPCIKR